MIAELLSSAALFASLMLTPAAELPAFTFANTDTQTCFEDCMEYECYTWLNRCLASGRPPEMCQGMYERCRESCEIHCEDY